MSNGGKRVQFICIFIIGIFVLGILSCASQRPRARYEKPKRGKPKPCNCPTFRYTNFNDYQWVS